MTIKDLVRVSCHINPDTEFVVTMPEGDKFRGTLNELPACATSIEMSAWSVVDYNPRSRLFTKIMVLAKEYKYAAIKT